MRLVHALAAGLAALAISLPASAVAAELPAAEWHLDQVSGGAETPDSSGNGRPLEVTGAGLVPGRFGNALSFEAGDNALLGEAKSLGLEPAAVTAMAWVKKTTGAPGNFRYVIGKGASACTGASWGLYTGAGGGMQFYVKEGATTFQSPAATAAAVWDGNWHAVAGSFDGSTVRLYVDGAEVGGGTAAPGAISYELPERALSVGDYANTGCGNGITAAIDEARVYGRALAPAEIAQLQNPAASSPPELGEGGGGGGGPGVPPVARITAQRAAQAVKVKGATLGGPLTSWIGTEVKSPSGAPITHLRWDLDDDGTTDVECPPEATALWSQFHSPGTYTPVLTVEDSSGATDTTQTSVTLRKPKKVKKAGSSSAGASKAKKQTKEMAEMAACLTQKDTDQPSTADCTRLIQFSVIAVNARSDECFDMTMVTPKASDVFTSSGAHASIGGPAHQTIGESIFRCFEAAVAGPVEINGLYVKPPSVIRTHYNSCTDEIGLGERTLEIEIAGHPVKLAGLNLNRSIADTYHRHGVLTFDLGVVKLNGFPGLGGLKAGSEAALRWIEPGRTQIDVDLKLPNVFSMPDGGPVEGQIQASGGNADKNAFSLDTLHVRIPKFAFGPVGGKNFELDYQGNGEIWNGGATFVVPGEPDDMELVASRSQGPEYGVEFAGGSFRRAGGEVDFGPYAPEIFPGLKLQAVGFSFAARPTRFTGTVLLNTAEIVYVRGSVLAAFPSGGEAWTIPDGLPGLPRLGGRTVSAFTLGAGGEVYFKVLGYDLHLGDAFVLYTAPDRFEFAGGVDVPLGAFHATGEASGFLDVGDRAFNMEGHGKFCVEDIDACLAAELLLSSKGIAGCGGFEILGESVLAGAGYSWGEGLDGVDVYLWGCEVAPWRVYAGSSSARASAASSTFKLKPGLPFADLKLTGSGAEAPRVVVHGPKGETYSTGAANKGADGRFAFIRVPGGTNGGPADGTAYIGVKDPSAGTWTVTAEPGSAPFQSTEVANGYDPPKVHAHVSGHGAKRTLSYEVEQRPGEEVVFAELGKDSYSEIGKAKRARGTLRFEPGGWKGGKHRILALVEREGVVVNKLKLGSFKAPALPHLTRPAGLRLSRRGHTVRARWRPERGTRGYVVTLRTDDGFARAVQVKKPSASFGGISEALGGRVSVAAIRVDRAQGPLAKARFSARSGRRGARARSAAAPRPRPLARSHRRTG
jgi:PKD repeat protein